ncbi:MAG: response regulator [Proteobacteria bacterium]|nr:response regulator [Pseudomonadota bacterium]MBI3496797.1 response regulator [Pseudomonadota bacterium]
MSTSSSARPSRLNRLGAWLPFAVVPAACALALALAVLSPWPQAAGIALAGAVLLAAALAGRWLGERDGSQPARAVTQGFEAGIASVVTDAAGRALAANAAARRILAEGRQQPRQRRLVIDEARLAATFADPDGRIGHLAREARAGHRHSVDLRLDPGVGRGWLEVTAAPAPGQKGWVVWRFAEANRRIEASLDLVAERSHSAELRVTLASIEQRFQRFFEELPVGWAVVDGEGRIEDSNRAFRELVGVPLDPRGRNFATMVRAEDQGRVAARIEEAMRGGTQTAPEEVRFSGTSERVASLYVGRIDTPDDSPAGLVLHLLDISTLKALESQFVQSQKMQAIGQLAGGVAHDFNNLLTAMIGYSDLLLLRHRPGDPSFADIMQVKQNANRAANLVRQLLAFSRQQTLRPRVLNLTDVLAELSHLLRRLLGDTLQLEVVHGRDLKPVKVDQGQFEQVVINLAVNARDAMHPGGRLAINTANIRIEYAQSRGAEVVPAGDYVEIRVADTGSGIAPEHLGRIFEPFFSTKPVGSGTGLGLSTVYGIVKQTGGFVFVESMLGGGTSFTIWLPVHAGGVVEEAAEEEEGRRQVRDLTGAGTILLVEDEDPVRLFSARALRSKGYKVFEARSGEAALDLLLEETMPVDLLITDMMMPTLDGPSLVKLARERRPDLKVVCISGYTEDTLRERIPQDDITVFLAKPFSLKQLAQTVKEVLTQE